MIYFAVFIFALKYSIIVYYNNIAYISVKFRRAHKKGASYDSI